jgi:hypothetical protein
MIGNVSEFQLHIIWITGVYGLRIMAYTQYGIYGYPHIRHIYDNIDPSITLTQFPDSILASPWQQPSAYFFIESHHEFTPMFNDLTAADHAYITPRRIDSASALSRSMVRRHLMQGGAGALQRGALELSEGRASCHTPVPRNETEASVRVPGCSNHTYNE